MKVPVIPTLRLKLVRTEVSLFAVMNSTIWGWSTLRIAMLAPRLVPPCLTASVAALKTLRKDIGPLETPVVVFTLEFVSLSRLKLKPVPPPLLWIRAAFLIELKILSILSSIGKTKQADNCCRSFPAFIRVGELGRKLPESSRLQNFLKSSGSPLLILPATLSMSCSQSSIASPLSFFLKYLLSRTTFALSDSNMIQLLMYFYR